MTVDPRDVIRLHAPTDTPRTRIHIRCGRAVQQLPGDRWACPTCACYVTAMATATAPTSDLTAIADLLREARP